MGRNRMIVWLAGSLAVFGIGFAGAAGAVTDETVVFRTHTHFKLHQPTTDWKAKGRPDRMEWVCQDQTSCSFIIDFGGMFTYTCTPGSKLTMVQSQLIVPSTCTLP